MISREKLKALRERASLSQHDLADLAGLSRMAVGRIERGDSVPQPRSLRKLAAALGVSPAELMEEQPMAKAR